MRAFFEGGFMEVQVDGLKLYFFPVVDELVLFCYEPVDFELESRESLIKQVNESFGDAVLFFDLFKFGESGRTEILKF